jgi:hypothetical protein
MLFLIAPIMLFALQVLAGHQDHALHMLGANH